MTPISEAVFDLTSTAHHNDDHHHDNDETDANDRTTSQPFRMRVRFGTDPHWQHLDERAARVLLQLPADADWQTVRSILFRLGHFHYIAAEANATVAPAFGAANRSSSHPLAALMERVVRQLFASRSVETAGLAVQPHGAHSAEASVHRLVDVVLQHLRAEQLHNRDTGQPQQRGAATVEPLPSVVERYVLDGLRRARDGGRK